MSALSNICAFKERSDGGAERLSSNQLKCGICGKEGGDKLFPMPDTYLVHGECYELIGPARRRLAEITYKLFNNRNDSKSRRDAHMRAVRAVQKGCAPEMFSSYVSTKGIEALTRLFDTVGMDAAKGFASPQNQMQTATELFEGLGLFDTLEKDTAKELSSSQSLDTK